VRQLIHITYAAQYTARERKNFFIKISIDMQNTRMTFLTNEERAQHKTERDGRIRDRIKIGYKPEFWVYSDLNYKFHRLSEIIPFIKNNL
jgi:hypothetical protein